MALLASCLGGFAWAFHAMVRDADPGSDPNRVRAITLLVLLGRDPSFVLSHPCDPPTLLRFTLDAWAALRRQRKPFVFALACLNEDSAARLLLPALLERRATRDDARSILVLASTYAVTAPSLRAICRNDPGTLFEVPLAENLRMAAEAPWSVLLTVSIAGLVAYRTHGVFRRATRAVR